VIALKKKSFHNTGHAKKFLASVAFACLATSAIAQTIEVTAAEEKGRVLELTVITDMAMPFYVMAGVTWDEQKPDEVFLGVSVRYRITSSPQVLSIPIFTKGELLPAGEYLAEVAFYTRWGAKDAPVETRIISSDVFAKRLVTLEGSGIDAVIINERNNRRLWGVLNLEKGTLFDEALIHQHLGENEVSGIRNRGREGVARVYYYPRSDMSIFVSNGDDTILDWRMGKADWL